MSFNLYNFKRPCTQTVLAFFNSKGWKVEQTSTFYKLLPPSEFEFENPNFFARIPLVDEHLDDDYAFVLVRNIAEMYHLSVQDLLNLFSKNPDEIRKEVEAQPPYLEMQRALLAHAR